MFESAAPASEYGAEAAETGLEFRGAIAVRAVVNKMGEELFVRADVGAEVMMECARCLEPFARRLSTVFEALYVPQRQEGAGEPAAHRAERESQRVHYHYGGVVDLGQEILEALALAVPMKPLCRPDCRGICPKCGKNLNEGACGCKKGGGLPSPFEGLF